MINSISLRNGSTGYFISTVNGYCTFTSSTTINKIEELISSMRALNNE